MTSSNDTGAFMVGLTAVVAAVGLAVIFHWRLESMEDRIEALECPPPMVLAAVPDADDLCVSLTPTPKEPRT